MKHKLFTVKVDPSQQATTQVELDMFLQTVEVKKTATQFVPGNPDFWSILIFFEEKSVTPDVAPGPVRYRPKKYSEEDLSTETQKQVYACFKIWRKEMAAQVSVPEFMVAHNSQLAETAYFMPRTEEELSKIKGIRQEHYADILAIVNAF